MGPKSSVLCSLLLALLMTVSSLASARPSQASPPLTSGEILAQARAVVAGGPNAASPAQAMSSAERAVYAAREVSSRGARSFRGGDEVVVVSAGAVVLVLAVVLIVLLVR